MRVLFFVDYKEEQANELEALQSIYPDEYEEISSDPGEFTILIVPDEQDGEDTCKVPRCLFKPCDLSNACNFFGVSTTMIARS